jgi:hypothetical protein
VVQAPRVDTALYHLLRGREYHFSVTKKLAASHAGAVSEIPANPLKKLQKDEKSVFLVLTMLYNKVIFIS